jgi:hypothetical protein
MIAAHRAAMAIITPITTSVDTVPSPGAATSAGKDTFTNASQNVVLFRRQ